MFRRLAEKTPQPLRYLVILLVALVIVAILRWVDEDDAPVAPHVGSVTEAIAPKCARGPTVRYGMLSNTKPRRTIGLDGSSVTSRASSAKVWT